MLRYLGFATAEKVLSALPGGEWLYRELGEVANRRCRGFELDLMREGVEAVAACLKRVRRGARVLDLGTGWHHKDALLYALTGHYQVIAYDVHDLVRPVYLRNYLALLDRCLPELALAWALPETTMRERLDAWRDFDAVADLRARAGIEMIVSPEAEMPFDDDSLGFVSSYCVLPHIEPWLLERELRALTRALGPEGCMQHMLGYADHHSFRDRRVSRLQHLRYSACCHRLLLESRLQYQNRWLWSDYQRLFDALGLEVLDERSDLTEQRLAHARRMQPTLAPRFRDYPLEDLAREHSTVLLRAHPAAAPLPSPVSSPWSTLH